MYNIHWYEKISNEKKIRRRSNQRLTDEMVKKKNYSWLSHIRRRFSNGRVGKPFRGSRKQGIVKITWRRSVETGNKRGEKSWRKIKQISNIRVVYYGLTSITGLKDMSEVSQQKEKSELPELRVRNIRTKIILIILQLSYRNWNTICYNFRDIFLNPQTNI